MPILLHDQTREIEINVANIVFAVAIINAFQDRQINFLFLNILNHFVSTVEE